MFVEMSNDVSVLGNTHSLVFISENSITQQTCSFKKWAVLSKGLAPPIIQYSLHSRFEQCSQLFTNGKVCNHCSGFSPGKV